MIARALSRREVLKYCSAGAAVLSLEGWLSRDAAAQGAPRIRAEASTAEGQRMLRLYASAVREMQKLPFWDPFSWRFQASIHWLPPEENPESIFDTRQTADPVTRQAILRFRGLALGGEGLPPTWSTCPHGDPHFLTWHRMYLMFFERIVARIVGQPFALPYWDYTHSERRQIPADFRSETDASGVKNPLWFPERLPGVNTPGPRPPLRDRDVSSAALFREDSLLGNRNGVGFSPSMENVPHGQVHVRIGTGRGMGHPFYAALDPIFWLHHATIDWLWESWRQPLDATGSSRGDRSSSDDREDGEWRNASFAFVSDLKERIVVSAAEMLRNTGTIGYRYDSLMPRPQLVAQERSRPNPFSATLTSRVIAEHIGGGGAALRVSSAAAAQVTLAPAVTPFALNAPGRQAASEYTLVLDGVQSEESPVAAFDVYLNAESGQTDAERERRLVGSFNLFGAGHHGGTARVFAFDVTRQAGAGVFNPSDPSGITITVESRGENIKSPVVIGRIALIAK